MIWSGHWALPAKEVESLLAGREDTTQLGPQFQRCVELLDQLNQAHEEAAKAQTSAQQQRTTVEKELASLTEAALPPQEP